MSRTSKKAPPQIQCGACFGSGVNAHSGAEFGCEKTKSARVGMSVQAIQDLKCLAVRPVWETRLWGEPETSQSTIPAGSIGEVLEADANTSDLLVSFRLFGDGIWFKARLFREAL